MAIYFIARLPAFGGVGELEVWGVNERIWTDDEVFELNAHQHRGDAHPYTCGNESRHRPLIATPQGWRCADCDYRQGWAQGVPQEAAKAGEA